MSQTLREEPRCPLILPLPSRSDSAISANAAVGGIANGAALRVVLLGMRHLCRVSVPRRLASVHRTLRKKRQN